MKSLLLTTITFCLFICANNKACAQTSTNTAKKKTTSTAKKTTNSTAKKTTAANKTGSSTVAKNNPANAIDSTKKVIKDTTVIAQQTVAVAETPKKTQVVQASYTTTSATASPAKPTAATPVFQNPFKKGIISFVNRENLDYYRSKENHLNNNTTSDFYFAGGVNYFFLNNLAVGVDFTYSNYSSKPSPSSTYYYYAGYLSVMYGRAITPRVSVYAKISGGLGHSRSGPTTVLEADYKDIYGTIGAPIAITNEGSIFLTPYAVYDKYKTKAGNHDITETGFTFGVRMESYLNRSNNKNANQPISPWPKKGASFIEYNTSASYGFSTRKEYQGNIRFGDVKRSNTTIGLGYHYYFLDFLAGGLNISYTRTSSNNGSPDIRKTFTVQPTVTANLPVETSLKNLFLQAGYELLKANNTGTKEDGHSIYLRLGYNLFLAKNISLTPKIGYQNNKSTHHTSGSDVPYKDNGLAAELGIRAWLNTTNWFKK